MIKALFKDKHRKLFFIQRIILVFICIFFLLIFFKFINQIVLQIIELNKKNFNFLEIFLEILLTISSITLASSGIALVGLYFTLANYLRKHGNQVDAILGIELGEKTLILANKKDKPLVFNSISLLIEKDKYLELSSKDQEKLKTSSQYEVISPYSTLTIKLKDTPLLEALFNHRSEISIKIVLTTDEGLTICNELEVLPIQIRALRDSKNFKILDPNTKLDI
ncbi:hypothetical protein [Acinetobacter johnsonii]|uniref:hypothetical protein n=2 Tax=Acinetobacter johnsonii TaxID=40214 RepID=UPI0002D60011|nr:hypothetical protein [Acinetobacter johnsonii]MDC4829631.1 hypothetical protein [Acinetobacter baumannii]MDC5223965.1 hypothetical protein [Acinetobacter baumannii]MDC5237886.1 hypothetical protein [Acinetobacter baumannii]MDC5533378.1 hypothetical protein [Acinetobacter baumannii]